jgi:two-component system copper resistance phosphate regulon response regulator CusR
MTFSRRSDFCNRDDSALAFCQTTEARRRILIIEDDRETARQLLEFFGEDGYYADLALNGSDGLRLALSAP